MLHVLYIDVFMCRSLVEHVSSLLLPAGNVTYHLPRALCKVHYLPAPAVVLACLALGQCPLKPEPVGAGLSCQQGPTPPLPPAKASSQSRVMAPDTAPLFCIMFTLVLALRRR